MRMAAVIGHRGAARVAPENTLAGIRVAKVSGLEWVEMDVILMGDGSLIMHHDRTLNRCTSGRGEVLKLGIDDLQGVDAGAGEVVPTLQQALDLVQQLGMGINLEIKMHRHSPEALVVPVLEMLKDHPLVQSRRILISSFDHHVLQLCRQLRPDIPVGHLFEGLPKDWLVLLQSVGAVAVHTSQRLVKKDDVVGVREAGFEVYCYTVNDARKAIELFSWGVTGVFTDDPDTILNAINHMRL